MSGRAEPVCFHEITPENRSTIEALTVTEAQSHYVAGVADSLLKQQKRRMHAPGIARSTPMTYRSDS
jgi:hypothetical protein